jgi:hypothetical protein
MRTLAVLLLLAAFTAAAQSPNQKWETVKSLTTGTEVRIAFGSRTVRGDLIRATDDTLVVAAGKGQEMFTRQEITRISVRSGSSRGRHALIGAVIGGAGGAAFGGGFTAAVGFADYAPAAAGVVGGAGALVGALIGAAIPGGGWREVYKK